jgi:hypothetical protein
MITTMRLGFFVDYADLGDGCLFLPPPKENGWTIDEAMAALERGEYLIEKQ